MIGSIIMVLLFINEYFNYRRYNMATLMYVDNYKGSDNLPVNINLEFENIPCELIAIEIRNKLGLKVPQINGNITQYTISQKGEILSEKPYVIQTLGTFGHDHEHLAQPNYETVKGKIQRKEGCRLKGRFLLDAVPGNFIFSSKGYAPTIERLRREGLDRINLEHTIKELSFGPRINKFTIFGFGIDAYQLMHTLQNRKYKNEKTIMWHLYYLKIVPTKFRYFHENKNDYYQYTANHFSENTYGRLPEINFNYDLSPITVEYKYTKMHFSTFLINVFAILGGVFTVAGIIDAIIHKSVLMILRKAQMNKLA